MFDLFSGTRSASEIFERNGWQVITVELEDGQDIMTWDYKSQPRPDFIWASPPCTEYCKSSMPWYSGIKPDMTLFYRAKQIIEYWCPRYWVIENVRGAMPFFNQIIGQPKRCGSRYLWGNFPIFSIERKKCYGKWKMPPSPTRARERSRIPAAITRPLFLAITQHMAAEQQGAAP